ncbi:RcgA family putative transporter [Oceanicola sp. S124]|uniref:RcgA family putative transporter n=1 Tax=Oceanicola sp. S124 TaxID=1042378 RepID=UPI0006830C47|nr:hypothetical protein [Oceanicola sp. S124]
MALIKNGKFFQPPHGGSEDFKELFARVAAAGVGRPVDKDGFPQGPWTPDLLAAAISQISVNPTGIELRTVQLWFENNDKGISSNNIRWLARVLGCNDPEAASAWQAELSAAQSRLVAKRRAVRRSWNDLRGEQDVEHQLPAVPEPAADNTQGGRFSIARVSEAAFSSKSFLNLPASIFAGAVALQFVSYFLGIHSVTYADEDGIEKQVGFLWAPNWTFLFIVLMPLFLSLVVHQIADWKSTGRSRLIANAADSNQLGDWQQRVDASSYTFAAVFLICIGFAGIFQWIYVRLIPVLHGKGNYAIDWGSKALVRPDEIGVVQQVAFSGAAYLYMSVCFYLFVAGLILLTTLIDDFTHLEESLHGQLAAGLTPLAEEVGTTIMRGVFRCTVAGLLIAICMKLQSLYVVVSAPNIWSWLVSDIGSVPTRLGQPVDWGEYSMPTHYTSLLVAFLVCVVFTFGVTRIGLKGYLDIPLPRMTTAVLFLTLVYLLIGVITGFTVLLGIGIVVALYGLIDPGFGTSKKGLRDGGYVL